MWSVSLLAEPAEALSAPVRYGGDEHLRVLFARTVAGKQVLG